VSHIPPRKENDCLNCGTIVQGRYCHVCGQENVVPKESFWHMVTHFFYDVTHFDSNFFHTVHHLLFKPGFLSKEYTAGRRVSYLHPIRMYVFTSAVFFLLFFSAFNKNNTSKTNLNDPLSRKERAIYIKDLKRDLRKDSSAIRLKDAMQLLNDTTRPVTRNELMETGVLDQFVSFSGEKYKSRHEYDSVQKALGSKERDSWLRRRMVYKEIDINEKIRENPNEALEKFSESLLHRLPYMLFISLPLFALILKLVYIRRKQFYFSDHGVFTIHLYVFSFLQLIAVFAVGKLQDVTHIDELDFVVLILFLLLFFYLYKAMRNFYGQGRIKTFIKFLLVALLSLIMMLVLFVFFLFFSAVTF
jgi:hypothetical protein